jgi:hypothetical protein
MKDNKISPCCADKWRSRCWHRFGESDEWSWTLKGQMYIEASGLWLRADVSQHVGFGSMPRKRKFIEARGYQRRVMDMDKVYCAILWQTCRLHMIEWTCHTLFYFFFFFSSNIKDSPSSLIANSAWVLVPTGAFVPLWPLYLDRWLYVSCTPGSGIESICSHISINYFPKFIGFIGSMTLNLELSFTMKSSLWLVDVHTTRSKFRQNLNKDTSLRNYT